MKKDPKEKSGIHRLWKIARNMLRTENDGYYSGEDYRTAERKFLKYALEQRKVEMLDKLFKE